MFSCSVGLAMLATKCWHIKQKYYAFSRINTCQNIAYYSTSDDLYSNKDIKICSWTPFDLTAVNDDCHHETTEKLRVYFLWRFKADFGSEETAAWTFAWPFHLTSLAITWARSQLLRLLVAPQVRWPAAGLSPCTCSTLYSVKMRCGVFNALEVCLPVVNISAVAHKSLKCVLVCNL